MNNKQRYWDYWQALSHANLTDIPKIMDAYLHEDSEWHGPEPINQLNGIPAIAEGFVNPLKQALSLLHYKPYILMEGQYKGGDWVSSTGYFTGIFTEDWLGIPATGQAVWLRCGEFARFSGGKIAETRIIVDIPEFMWQLGYEPFPTRLAKDGFAPAPSTHDGLLFADQDHSLTHSSLELVESMIFAGLMTFDGSDLESMAQERFWHGDMGWYGPHGIGTTYGLSGFKQYHQGPFLEAFPDRKGGNHNARFADGHYIASTGWPSLNATHKGSYLGIAATNMPITMRVMDWWRAEAGLLAENWIFIDMIDLFKQFGVDVFECLNQTPKPVMVAS
ncbi:MAG: ester cyclase [Deinococcota bacterium]